MLLASLQDAALRGVDRSRGSGGSFRYAQVTPG